MGSSLLLLLKRHPSDINGSYHTTTKPRTSSITVRSFRSCPRQYPSHQFNHGRICSDRLYFAFALSLSSNLYYIWSHWSSAGKRRIERRYSSRPISGPDSLFSSFQSLIKHHVEYCGPYNRSLFWRSSTLEIPGWSLGRQYKVACQRSRIRQ